MKPLLTHRLPLAAALVLTIAALAFASFESPSPAGRTPRFAR